MSVDARANPFVGLRPFESDESLLFFGRQKQVLELLERLYLHRFVAVTGSSGCGKSSLIRAGLIPKLRAGYLVDDRDKWIIVVTKPGNSPVMNLTQAIWDEVQKTEVDIGSDDVQRTRVDIGGDGAAFRQRVRDLGADAILEALKPFWEGGFSFFLLVDQFEELFFDMEESGGGASDEAIDFVNILFSLSSQKELPIYIMITMRSDYIGDCAAFYGLPEALNAGQYLVPRLNRIQLKRAIEGPVRLCKGHIHPGLTERLLNDAQRMRIELPLLQHVLMRMWDLSKALKKDAAPDAAAAPDAGEGGHVGVVLDTKVYRLAGGIENALSMHAEEALEGMSAVQGGIAKKLFQALTKIDEKGRKTRRKVRLRELSSLTGAKEEELMRMINLFNAEGRSFLVVARIAGTDDRLIDISHESLIQQWHTLNAWVDEEAESARIFLRLAEATELHERKEKDLLAGNELHTLWEWYRSFRPDVVWAQRYKANPERSVRYLLKSEAWERRMLSRKRLTRVLLLAGISFIALLIGAFAIVIYVDGIKRKKLLGISYWDNSYAARNEKRYLDALQLIAEAGVLVSDRPTERNLMADGHAFLPRYFLEDIFMQPDIVTNAVLGHSNTRILISSNDGNAYMLDRDRGMSTATKFTHLAPVMSAVYNRNENWVLTASNDRTSCIWDALTGRKIKSFQHAGSVYGAVFSYSESMILTACSDSNAYLWDVATGKLIGTLPHVDAVNSAVFSPDDKEILTASDNGDMAIWDAARKKKIRSFHEDAHIGSAVFNHDGKEILAAAGDGFAYVMDAVSGKKRMSLPHPERVTAASYSPDGKWILTACRDKLAYLWDAATGKLSGAPMREEGAVYCAGFSPDGSRIVTAGGGKDVRIWRRHGEEGPGEGPAYAVPDKINSVCYSPDGGKVLISVDKGLLYIWNTDHVTGRDSVFRSAAVRDAVFDPQGNYILTREGDSSVHILAIKEGREIASVKLGAEVSAIACSPNGRRILTGSSDGFVRTWDEKDLSREKCIDSFRYGMDIQSVSMSPDARKVLVAGGDSAVLWDPELHKVVISFVGHEDIVKDAHFSPDGRWVVTASWDRTVRMWDAVSGSQAGPSMRHRGYAGSAAFSPGGEWIYVTDFDSVSHLWDAGTKKEIGLGPAHKWPAFHGVFSPDGRSVLTAGSLQADIIEIGGDLDIPADLFRLQVQVITGGEYLAKAGEIRCLAVKDWHARKEAYAKQAAKHALVCRYPRYNVWLVLKSWGKEAE